MPRVSQVIPGETDGSTVRGTVGSAEDGDSDVSQGAFRICPWPLQARSMRIPSSKIFIVHSQDKPHCSLSREEDQGAGDSFIKALDTSALPQGHFPDYFYRLLSRYHRELEDGAFRFPPDSARSHGCQAVRLRVWAVKNGPSRWMVVSRSLVRAVLMIGLSGWSYVGIDFRTLMKYNAEYVCVISR